MTYNETGYECKRGDDYGSADDDGADDMNAGLEQDDQTNPTMGNDIFVHPKADARGDKTNVLS